MLTASLLLLGLQATTQVSLSVQGLPADHAPMITVTLPSGQTTEVAAGSQWTANLPGTYRASAEPFRAAGKLVDVVYDVAGSSVTVKAGEKATLSVRFSVRPGSGMLWMATPRTDAEEDDFTVGNLRGWLGKTLETKGFSKPDRLINSGPRLSLGSVLPDGTLLYTDHWDNSAVMLAPPAVLGGAGKPAPVKGTEALRTLISPQGKVWIFADVWARRYPASVLKSGIEGVAPEVTLSAVEDDEEGARFSNALFDGEGALILVTSNRLQRIPASELNSSKSIRGGGATFSSGALGSGAFDQEGNLWLPGENSVVYKVTKAELAKTGPISPQDFKVDQSAASIAVDNEGGVWCFIRYTGEVLYLKPKGTQFEPQGRLGLGTDESSTISFNPPPVWSPLAAAPGFPKRLPGK